MKRILTIAAALTAMIIIFSCAGIYYGPAVETGGPVVRVGLLEDMESIAFEPQGDFVMAAGNGRVYRLKGGDVWQAKLVNGRPAEQVYRIMLEQSSDLEKAETALHIAQEANRDVELVSTGDVLTLGRRVLIDRQRHRVLLKEAFATERDARLAIGDRPDLGNVEVIAMDDGKPTGEISLESAKGKKIVIQDALRISGALVGLQAVRVGEGFHWSREESRKYSGEIELLVGPTGKLYAVNVLTLSAYLEGVLPGEMMPTFPLEALKAQAVAARTFFLYNFGRRYKDMPFDVTDDVYSQAFVGAGRSNKSIQKAIRETQGQVLTHRGELCSTPYSAVCGGHTENAENVWAGDPIPYLSGVLDDPKSRDLPASLDLSTDAGVRRWIKSVPKVNCNAAEYGTPDYAAYSTKYFRWQQRYTRQELEAIILKKNNRDIGTLLDIVPLSRGVSGRIIEIDIRGTADHFTVRKELNIRRALSETALNSACFVVDKEVGADGLPEAFVISGAGWGHGVGMCQIGAAMMAEQGTGYRKILTHYYRGAQVDKFY